MRDIWVHRAEEKCPNYFIWALNKQRWLNAERRVEAGALRKKLLRSLGWLCRPKVNRSFCHV